MPSNNTTSETKFCAYRCCANVVPPSGRGAPKIYCRRGHKEQEAAARRVEARGYWPRRQTILHTQMSRQHYLASMAKLGRPTNGTATPST